MFFSSDIFHYNKLWKNSLDKSAIREGHSDLEHIVLSWQEKDAVMKLWDASAVAVAVKWVERQCNLSKNISHLASRN